MTNNFYPFSAAPGNPQLAYLPYDLEIEKIDPGIILYPDEPGGVLTVFREVAGVSWWVVNADYDTDNAIWTQVAPSNAANPAFAVTQDAGGNFMRLVALATVIPGNEVVWNVVATTDLNGYNTLSPNVGTSITQIIQNLVDTWNAGTSAAMVARQVTITDMSSAAASLVDNLVVDDVPVWSVRKDGTLVVGKIPYTALVIPNPWTIDVPVTFTDPVTMDDGLTVTGGINADHITTTGNETVGGNLTVDGTSTLDGAVTAAGGLDVTGGTLASSVPVTFTDGETVTGGLTVDTLTVTGNETVDGNLTVDGSVTAAAFNNPAGQPGSTIPVYVTTAFTSPAVGSNATVPITSTYGLIPGQTIIVADLAIPCVFSATVVSLNAIPTTSIVIKAEYYGSGSSGLSIAIGSTLYPGSGIAQITSPDGSTVIARVGNEVTLSSPGVAPVVPGSWFIQTEYVPATGTPQSGTVSLGPLPGTTANTFRIVYWGVTGFKDGNSNMVFTGTPATNVTWDQATVTVFNGQGNATPFMYFGTAKGGTTPTVSWTTTDYVFATPFMATIAAGIQL